MSPALFEPMTLRSVEIRNRIWVPPMCQYAVEKQDGVPTDWHFLHYASFARGGAGAVIVEATGVVPEGRISPRDLGLWNDEQRDAFVPINEIVHSLGATTAIQLAHAGRKASVYPEWGTSGNGSLPIGEGGWPTVAPSAVPYPGLKEPQPLDQAGIDAVVGSFAAAARRSLASGFDMIEIHAAHGYLFHEFLSPLSNLRDDNYGGPLENRVRILTEAVDAVRASIPGATPLLVRLSATDWAEGGLTVEETVRVVEILKDHGVDFADISTGANVPARIPVGPGYQVPFATAVKEATGIPTSAVGRIDDPFQAEQIVATGLADVAMIGREFLRDANFALHAAESLGIEVPYRPAPYLRAYR
ncbi:NADH:flavin oxidoreductase/NADH oxidase [Paenarthrobacter nicotinovorans]|uniref:NADH:flavin oxidoreductase/NADH oxidase n=1 Tax=Paenarthrobacter nicotinovorans TaxID=29320 RepID=UPI003813E9A4